MSQMETDIDVIGGAAGTNAVGNDDGLLPAGWTWNDLRASEYVGLTCEETLSAYRRRLRGNKAAAIAGVLAFLAGNMVAIFVLDSLFWYLVSLAGIVACAIWYGGRASKLFLGLADIAYLDCDPARYRYVLEHSGGRFEGKQSRSLRQLELAYCDYLQNEPMVALERLQRVWFSKPSNPLWFRAMQVEAYSRMAVRDAEGLQQTFARMQTYIEGMRPATRSRALCEDALAAMKLQATPVESWGVYELGRAQDHLVRSSRHIEYAGWYLRIASYGAANGMGDKARALLRAPGLEPLVPVHERMRDELLQEYGAPTPAPTLTA